MNRFLVSKVCLCVGVLFSLCGITVLVGHQQGAPTIIPELKPCGEALCYLDILPGTTGWDAGRDIIKRAPQLKVSDNSDKVFLSVDPKYSIEFLLTSMDEFDHNAQVVEAINIDLEQENFYAGYVIQKYGIPCFILSMYGGWGMLYPNAIFVVGSDVRRVAAESPVRYVLLRQPTTGSHCPDAGFISPFVIYEWKGFRRYF